MSKTTTQSALELDQSAPPTGLAKQESEQNITIIQIISKIANTPNLTLESVAIVEKLVAMQERQEAKKREDQFFEILRECQKEMPRVDKNGLIDPKGAKIAYAKLDDLDACIRPVYERFGFSVYYDAPMTTEGGKIRTVAHFSCVGHTVTTEITAAPDQGSSNSRLPRSPVQAVKCTITASRRHLLELFFNIITVDADTDGMHPNDLMTITQDQADTLRDKLKELEPEPARFGVMLQKFFNIYKIRGLEQMKASDLNDAYARIESERRKR